MSPADEVYLDHNASSPLRPAAFDAMRPWLEGSAANPSSVHSAGTRARAALDDARARLADLIGAAPEEVVFTSGGTEANHLALVGVVRAAPVRHVVTSAVEHPSVSQTLESLAEGDLAVDVVAPAASGAVTADAFLGALRPETGLASLQWVNHETGAVHDVEQVAAAKGDVPLHVDAVQAFGRLPIDVAAAPIDLLAWSAHKIGGPPGVGALFVRRGVALRPLGRGGNQEDGKRSGTQPVALAVGFARAAELAHAEADERHARHAELRRRLVHDVLGRFPGARVFADDVAHASTACFGFPNVDRETLLVHLDLAGVRVSSGAACASGSIETSPVLRAMRVPEEIAAGALRVSFGPETNARDLERLLAALGPALDASTRP